MKTLCRFVAVCLALQLSPAVAQSVNTEPDRNPERRGIGALSLNAARKLSTPRTTAKLTVTLDERKSIFVTDLAILKLFTFDELMNKLVHDSGSHKLNKELLFQQWWDTANRSSDFNLGLGGPNCDSGQLNTFPYACSRDEGQQVMFNPFVPPPTPATYTAIALSNRFDLATLPNDGGTDCGEYRIVFERNSAVPSNGTNRNLIIFEAVLPNPRANEHSLRGCRRIQEFWEKLSEIPVTERGKRLHEFYYHGLPRTDSEPAVEAVVMASHYGSATKVEKGQIRTNQFMPDPSNPTAFPGTHKPWLLRQFHILRDSAMGIRIIPVPVANNPPGTLFDENNTSALANSFRNDFLAQVAPLSTPNINSFSMSTAAKYDAGESEEGGVNPTTNPGPMDFASAFKNSPKFRANIQAKIPAGSGLTPDDIVNRAQTQTCAGCHHLSVNLNVGGSLTWPATIPPTFTHEQLASPENGPDGPRYQISDALQKVFLPARKQLIEAFLAGP
jgi:hypothetical protein